ncbi:MAG: S46 family peptidase, partial [Bacteroidales bacterium]|nr:S46 family peptidase [Bacteroidales bacterium]
MRLYMKAHREFESDKTFYPDANFTLRITYGYVDGFKAQDAINYNYFTTLDGVMEKENPDIYDYVVEDKLKELYQNKDFGRYADKEDGKIHTCFIATNHTTGGNSGSPVLNAYGNLVGLNFDRNWQGTMSDIMYDPDKCRNIALDIRYCLFIIDKFAGASHLIDEMTIVENY